MTNLQNKRKLYKEIEELVSMKINEHHFPDFGYLLEKRVIAWGDSTCFHVNGNRFHVELIPYGCDFSDLLEYTTDEIVDKITTRVINDINEKIKAQIECCGVESNLKNFNHVVKLVLEGANICMDDKFVYKVGIATIF